jgi:hypothetical protein
MYVQLFRTPIEKLQFTLVSRAGGLYCDGSRKVMAVKICCTMQKTLLQVVLIRNVEKVVFSSFMDVLFVLLMEIW